MHAFLTCTVVGMAMLAQLAPPGRPAYDSGVTRCSCVSAPDAKRALRRTPHVFLGEVIAARDTVWALVPDSLFIDGAAMTIRVIHRWKGTRADTVTLRSSGMCDFRFPVGTRALIFAHGRPSALYTSVCLPTSTEAHATEALRALGPPRRR